MQDFLYRDRTELSVYAKGIFGLALAQVKADDRLAMIVRNMDQYLVQDDENQTACLKLPEGSFWWFWYDSETEANAYYLKLLVADRSQGRKGVAVGQVPAQQPQARDLLEQPPRHGHRHRGPGRVLVASGEDRPQTDGGGARRRQERSKRSRSTAAESLHLRRQGGRRGRRTRSRRAQNRAAEAGHGSALFQRLSHELHARGLHHARGARDQGRPGVLQADRGPTRRRTSPARGARSSASGTETVSPRWR